MDSKDLPDEQLLGIGEFSRYAGLSVRMLRHYAEREILVPVVVESHSGYRRYRPSQLQEAGRVRLLRDPGCGIPGGSSADGTRGTAMSAPVNYFEIGTADPQAARTFYGELFG